MAIVTFYEKPGCSGNARQKALLEASGHTVIARSILDTRWTRLQLLSFLKRLPVPDWFNRNAPQVKSGEIVPEDFDEAYATTALEVLQAEPLLIRRPLLEVDGERHAGFDRETINAWIGLAAAPSEENLESCRHGADGAARCHENERIEHQYAYESTIGETILSA